jgi:hypothetical protein
MSKPLLPGSLISGLNRQTQPLIWVSAPLSCERLPACATQVSSWLDNWLNFRQWRRTLVACRAKDFRTHR